MNSRRFTYVIVFFLFFLLGIITSCQKDAAVNEPAIGKTSLNADSSLLSASGNSLALSGTLKIKYNDTTYTFDAATDSIAFINVQVDENTRYFGITAINKAHSMSFGISSAGFANSNTNKSIAGSQFLLNTSEKKPALQLTLSRFSGQKDFGNINLVKYNEGVELAQGTFFTFLAKDDKANSPYYRVEGTFDLKLK